MNDILGCGIIFPVKYAELPEGSTWPWEIEIEHVDSSEETKPTAKARLPAKTRHRRKARSYGGTDNFGKVSSDDDDESEDDIWWNNIDQVCEDKVKVGWTEDFISILIFYTHSYIDKKLIDKLCTLTPGVLYEKPEASGDKRSANSKRRFLPNHRYDEYK